MTDIVVALIGLAGVLVTAIPAYRRTPRGRLGAMKHLDEFARETKDERVRAVVTRNLHGLAYDHEEDLEHPPLVVQEFVFIYFFFSLLVLGFVVTFGSDLAGPLNTTRGHLIALASKASLYLLVLLVLSGVFSALARWMMKDPNSEVARLMAGRGWYGPETEEQSPDEGQPPAAAPVTGE